MDEDDAADASTWYQDTDGDGYGDPGSSTTACTQPSGYVADDSDCDDGDGTVSPAATELCDGIDNDCDGSVDEGDAADAGTWYADTDGDGYGDPGSSTDSCGRPAGYVADATDCDDADGTVNPAATEYCDGIDNDCDGSVDEDDAADASTWYADLDGDSYGNARRSVSACSQPSGYVADDTDCDDADGTVNPVATELCDGIDNDCDGSVDEDDAADASTWYADTDGDGYGDAASSAAACSEPSGYVADATDCDDADGTVNPAATEYCDGIDNDCDGGVDEDDAVGAGTWYADVDGDGYGDPGSSSSACAQPSGYVADDSDCDDADGAQYPGADEYCNGEDDDCDGTVDEDEAVDASTWYADVDGDGYGDPASSSVACVQPSGYVADDSDCDDTEATTNPGATEVWYDGVDADCDGHSDYDQDYDDFDSRDETDDGEDCDDTDADVNPDATEVWYDGVDSDCDDWSDYDADGDGYDSASYGGDDCDDADDATYPGAPDDPYDGVINDCDDADEYDADGDGYDSVDHGGDDCDDANSDINPGAEETWYDGVDDDCDGNDDDQDGDGFPLDDDCDDTDADIYPGADGWDDECEPIVEDTADTAFEADDTGSFKFTGGGGDCGCAAGGRGAALGLGLAPFLLGLAALRRRRFGVSSDKAEV